MQNKPNFRKAQMNANVFITMNYENKYNWTIGQNKPNSNPIQTQSNPISSKAKMSVNIYYTEDYENKWLGRVRKNKPNTNPIKANFNTSSTPKGIELSIITCLWHFFRSHRAARGVIIIQ